MSYLEIVFFSFSNKTTRHLVVMAAEHFHHKISFIKYLFSDDFAIFINKYAQVAWKSSHFQNKWRYCRNNDQTITRYQCTFPIKYNRAKNELLGVIMKRVKSLDQYAHNIIRHSVEMKKFEQTVV